MADIVSKFREVEIVAVRRSSVSSASAFQQLVGQVRTSVKSATDLLAAGELPPI